MGFDVRSSDVDGLYQSVSAYARQLDSAVNELQTAIDGLAGDGGFTGAAAANVKAYFSEVHGGVASALSELASGLKDDCARYVNAYAGVDSSPSFRFSDAVLRKAGDGMQGYSNRDRRLAEDLATVLGSVGDIVSIANPPVGGLDADLLAAKSEASDTSSKVAGVESSYASVAGGLAQLEAALRSAMASCGASGSAGCGYVKGSFAKSGAGAALSSAVASSAKGREGCARLVKKIDKAVDARQRKRTEDASKATGRGERIGENVVDAFLGRPLLRAIGGKVKRGTMEGRSLWGKGVHRADVTVLKLEARAKGVGSKALDWLKVSDGKVAKGLKGAVGKADKSVDGLLSHLPSYKHSQVAKDLNQTKAVKRLNAFKGGKAIKGLGILGTVVGVTSDAVGLNAKGYDNAQTIALTATHFAVDAAASAAGGVAGEGIGTVAGTAIGGLVGLIGGPGAVALGMSAGAAIGSAVGGILGNIGAGWFSSEVVDDAIDGMVRPDGRKG